MADLLPFDERLATSWPPERWAETGVLVAFSGGPDSAALLAALAKLRHEGATGRIVAGHFNHRLRGAESDADEAFAVEFAAGLGVECVVARGDVATAADERGDGVEEAARDARYRFLTSTAARLGLRYIATAHTLDDQAETVLHHLLRGTGLAGLAGIPRSRPVADGAIGLIRPMLGMRRSEVLDYLKARGLPYRIDASNADLRYTRNRIRHDLLPQLARDYNPQVVEALARLATQADELREAVDALVAPLAEQAVFRAADERCELDCRALVGTPRPLVREVLVAAWKQAGLPRQAMGFSDWDALASLALGDGPAKRMFPGGVTAERKAERVHISRLVWSPRPAQRGEG